MRYVYVRVRTWQPHRTWAWSTRKRMATPSTEELTENKGRYLPLSRELSNVG